MIGSLLEGVADAYFWDDWDTKFNFNRRKFVNPDDPIVSNTAREIQIRSSEPSRIAMQVSDWVVSNCEYDLSKEWKLPRDTITEGRGDCEDYIFLTASILPNLGVNNFTIEAGYASVEGVDEMHVWMVVDGEVIDPVAKQFGIQEVDYEPELSYQMEVEE